MKQIPIHSKAGRANYKANLIYLKKNVRQDPDRFNFPKTFLEALSYPLRWWSLIILPFIFLPNLFVFITLKNPREIKLWTENFWSSEFVIRYRPLKMVNFALFFRVFWEMAWNSTHYFRRIFGAEKLTRFSFCEC